MINKHPLLTFLLSETCYIRVFFFSFQKKIFFWYGRTGSLLKTRTHVVLTTILLQFFFLAGTIDSLNRTRGKQNLHDWYVCFMLSSLLISRKAIEISLTHMENCMYAHAGLDFVSCREPTKRSQPSDWQPQPPQKVATSI